MLKPETVVVPLFGGIGDLIMTLPFAFEMKRRYKEVNAYIHHLDCPEETLKLFEGVYKNIYPNINAITPGQRVFKGVVRQSRSEYMSWFIENNESLPTSYAIDEIGYTPSDKKHKVVIWTECKPNWPCKRWPYWVQFSNYIKDVAVVGIEDQPKFPPHVIDYRGKLTLAETGGVIKNAGIFIGNEGGLTHYSAALGTKTYIIYGCSDPVKSMPPKNAVKMSKNLPCQPCQFFGKGEYQGMEVRKTKPWTILGCQFIYCLKNFLPEEVISRIPAAEYL